ncbi:MAG: hypothetical protein KUL83_12600 [Lentimicrobium sp.]|jgi:hypothetical protein|nr:hypothetical protein [Lentimicrobium sp.]MDD2527706.1 hypothetical protein [Lentimicrobiaceae bacterium]MDD4597431.1 hypothetical protein [Lentimicrobiaceae bacterium]MDY0026447.1 hypothetical protein [Lentimicrobium sp.]HAH59391.1 membrane or secreted protein [Bacteroidales bacterium]
MILKVILLAVLIVGLSIAGIAIKMFAQKGGEFKKSCGSVDPHTGQRIGCSCGKAEDSTCNNT